MHRVFAHKKFVELIGLKRGFFSYFLAAAVLMALAAVPTASGQTIWHVDDDALNDPAPGDPTVSDPLEDGSADHPFDAIQEGIDAATDGDTVLVADGTYTGVGNKGLDYAGKAITLRSGNGPDACIIDCEDEGRGFYFHSGETNDAVVRGFTITNGNVAAYPYVGYGGGVDCNGSSPTITDCVISSCKASYGAGMCCSGTPVIDNCTIIGNSLDGWYIGNGGGLYLSGNPTVTKCTISGNDAGSSSSHNESEGGGVYCYSYSGSPLISECVIANNSATTGGGIGCRYGGPVISDCTIVSNFASGSGSYLDYFAGGGIFCKESDATIINCTIAQNTTGPWLSGGGICCFRCRPDIVNCLIAGNSAFSWGGGIYSHSRGPKITNCTIVANEAARGGGFGGDGGKTTLTNSVVWGNQASEGPELAIDGICRVSYSDVRYGADGVWGYGLEWGEGNIDTDPHFAFEDDYHLLPTSPCVDSGTNDPVQGLPTVDRDGNARPIDGDGDAVATADMGAYEFNPDTPSIALSPATLEFFAPEGQSNPDSATIMIQNCGGGTLHWRVSEDCTWLNVHPRAGQSAGEVDQVVVTADASGLAHGVYTGVLTVSDPLAVNTPREVHVTLYVNTTLSVPSAYPTIQAAIDGSIDGDVVLVADGTYTGPRNRKLDFSGRRITVRSAGGAQHCTIDCEGEDLAFDFHSSETRYAVVDGFTITNGYADSGGAICCSYDSNPSILNCVMTGNIATGCGGAVRSSYSSPRLADCTVIDNVATSGGGVCASGSPYMILERCRIEGNTASEDGGGLAGRLRMTDCFVLGNRAGACGGGISSDTRSVITNCAISGNSADGDGGGICTLQSSPTINNCTITGNSAKNDGGGIYCGYSSPTIINCTISGNSAADEGGGIRCVSSGPMITNCIVWANAPQEVSGPAESLTYCDVQGGWPGEGNIDTDPLFADLHSRDYRLLGGSPCIDAGDNDAVPADALDLDGDGDTDEPIPLDLDRNPRFIDDPATQDTGNGEPPIVDMGAYEFQVVRAHLDIKPGSCPNSLNLNGHGVLSAAIVGTAEFDVTQIDVDTLVLMRADGVGGGVTPLRGPPGPGIRVDDVAMPFDGEPCECHEYAGDGIDDLTIKFDNELVIPELQLAEFPGGTAVELVVSGQLLDGTPFAGTDCVTIRPVGPQPGAMLGAPDDEEKASQTTSESTDSQDGEQEAEQEALAMPSMACGMLSPVFLPMAVVGMSLLRDGQRRGPGRVTEQLRRGV